MSKTYEDTLLDNWELIFRQGLLTFWVFIAIRDNALSVEQIIDSVSKLTNSTYITSEQTVYRLLRKQYDLELVDYSEVAGNGGPNKKLYQLSPLGTKLLANFIDRNIRLFQQPIIYSKSKEK